MQNVKTIILQYRNNFYEKSDVFRIVFFLIISLYLFQGFFGYGLQFDKVFRVNNVIPFINENANNYNQAISSITIFGKKIPLMYKQYVSSASQIIRYLPLKYFDDYYLGLKTLDLIYFFLAIWGFYIIAKKYIKNPFSLALLLLLNPILYPEVLFGFASNTHTFFVVLSLHFFYKFYISNGENKWYLFGSAFFMFFTCNLFFYNVWILTSLAISTFLFYPLKWFGILKNIKALIIIIFASALGFINYVIYNIKSGFPSIKPLLLRLFRPDTYNSNPIDYKEAKPLIEEIGTKLTKIFPELFGDIQIYVVILFFIMLFGYGLSAFLLTKKGLIKKSKLYFLPFVNFLIIFSLILISPNTTRAGHYAYLSPFLELSIILFPIILSKSINSKIIKYEMVWNAVIIILFLVGSFSISAKAKINKGTDLFSPAIFELNNYLKSNNVDYGTVIHTQWGFYSQLYFLNKGEVSTRSLVFQLYGKKDDMIMENIISSKLKSIINENDDYKALYFPVYNNKFKQIKNALISTVEKYGGRVAVEKQFYEKNGKIVFKLLKVSNLKTLSDNIANMYINTAVTDTFKIKNLGIGGDGNAMWLLCEGHDNNTAVIINNTLCATTYYKDKLTCIIPKEVRKQSGIYRVELLDTKNNLKSKPFYF